jgi:CDP-glucose 4,6-dehydratase
MGAEITGYALPSSGEPNLFRIFDVEPRLTRSILADIRDRAALEQALCQAQPEVVIHMAAQPLVRRSYRDPVETYETNVLGTLHLLEAVRTAVAKGIAVKAVLNVTTDKCYDNKEGMWGYRETDPLGGYDPYSSSKACSELVTAAYRTSYFHPDRYGEHGVSVATARAGNVIGGGDGSEDRLIPDCLRALQAYSKVLIRRPDAVRPWQHVLEPLHGYLLLAERMVQEGPAFAAAWNFGPGENSARTVERVAAKLGELWGQPDFYEADTGIHPHEAMNLTLDSTKARQLLGWRPLWTVEQAIEKIVEWHQGYLEHRDVRAIGLQQIEAYLSGMSNSPE